jgi:hypothetical protein
MQPLQPGDSYETPLVYRVPAGARAVKLLIRTAVEPACRGHFLVGEEGSLFHKKVYVRVRSSLFTVPGRARFQTPCESRGWRLA